MKKTFYLYKSGELIRKDYSLVFIEKDGNNLYVPIEQINLIICFQDVTLNKRVLGLLNTYNISIFFYNYYGNYIGRFSPKKYSDGKIIKEQVLSLNNDKRIDIAIKITIGEVNNLISLLNYYQKKEHKNNNIIIKIKLLINDIKNTDNIENLLLLEAHAKKLYYSCIDNIIKNKEFIFDKRSFYPPKNEINALLSYGYSILYANILSDIDRSPLMPQLSYIHSLSKVSDSLQFDIADILKPILVDRLVFRLINKNQIRKEHFDYKESSCYLNRAGIKIFLEEYESLMKKSIKIGNKYYSYRNLITREVYALSNYISRKSKTYKPYVMEW